MKQRSTGRRLAMSLVVFVLIGLIASIAVAWVISVRASLIQRKSVSRVEHPDMAWIDTHCPRSPPVNYVARFIARGYLHDGYATHRNGYTPIFAYRVEAGWPVRCLKGGYWEELVDHPDKPWGDTASINPVHSFVGTTDEDDQWVMPYAPLWGGLAVNTAAYALSAWLLWQLALAPGRLRRRRWRRRGQCLACGYQLYDQSRCPECGRERADG